MVHFWSIGGGGGSGAWIWPIFGLVGGYMARLWPIFGLSAPFLAYLGSPGLDLAHFWYPELDLGTPFMRDLGPDLSAHFWTILGGGGGLDLAHFESPS